MATINVSLPDALRAFVDERVCGAGYGSRSEYIGELIRRDRDRIHLQDLLEEGEASATGEPASPKAFDRLRERARSAGPSSTA